MPQPAQPGLGRRALITGITGQTGSYLAELLLAKGYEVHGLVRRVSSFSTGRIDHIFDRLHLHHGDMLDAASLRGVLMKSDPDEIYNLAAQSHVHVSFEVPEQTVDVTGMGCLRLLEAVRAVCPSARFYQASSSEMFGRVAEIPQKETTPFYPRSPYGAAKCFAHHVTRNYREAYGLFAVNGICFNHTSPRRGETFVSRKVTRAVGRIAAGTQKKLLLGNMDAERDWGFAGCYARAMWLMLQQKEPEDLVIATGERHSVRRLVETAFERMGLDWQKHVEIDPRYRRPAEVDILVGDASKAKRLLGWEPTMTFTHLIRKMVDADFALAKAETAVRALSEAAE